MSYRLDSIVKEYREKKIVGQFVDLIPFTMNDANNVMEIRNRERNRYYLNQSESITLERQMKWYEDYLLRYDDIYWCIYNKDDRFIGTVRVYDIDEKKNMCEQGSLIIDENVAREAPYAVEVELLSIDFIFNTLKMESVINKDKADNKVMNSLTRKLGFRCIKDILIDGANYKYYLLRKEDYMRKREAFDRAINNWTKR